MQSSLKPRPRRKCYQKVHLFDLTANQDHYYETDNTEPDWFECSSSLCPNRYTYASLSVPDNHKNWALIPKEEQEEIIRNASANPEQIAETRPSTRPASPLKPGTPKPETETSGAGPSREVDPPKDPNPSDDRLGRGSNPPSHKSSDSSDSSEHGEDPPDPDNNNNESDSDNDEMPAILKQVQPIEELHVKGDNWGTWKSRMIRAIQPTEFYKYLLKPHEEVDKHDSSKDAELLYAICTKLPTQIYQ
jgi:hypothetical protein